MDRGNETTPDPNRRRLLAALAAAGAGSVAGCEGALPGTVEDRYDLASPEGTVEVTVELAGGRAQYAVAYDGRQVIEPSPLGLSFQAGELREGFEVVDAARSETDETWAPVWGRYDEIRDRHAELRLDLERSESASGSGTPSRLGLTFRAFEDGVAFRYRIPEQPGLGSFTLTGEHSTFRFAGDHDAWSIPGDMDSYEHLYERTPLSGVDTANTPVTVRVAEDCYASVHEAALVDYAGMTLVGGPDGPALESYLVPLAGAAKVRGETPHRSPWRTIQLGAGPGELVESSLLVNLNEPPAPDTDWSWIDPGTYLGIWWEIHVGKSTWTPGPDVGATTENAKRYVDFAAEHGIPYLLVEGWNEGWGEDMQWKDQDFTASTDHYDLEAVVEYGAERGVDLIAHCETGGAFRSFEEQLPEAFGLYEELGIPAVKTGYAGSTGAHSHHDQRLVNHHHEVVRRAADHGLLVNAHEAIKPTGLRRTYPNFVTRECVQGMEYNAWSEGHTADHTVTIPFTRMLAGPVDYTPGIFEIDFPEYDTRPGAAGDAPGNQRVHTTRAHQLALLVILFSGLQMAADTPDSYAGEPEFAFVEAVPADWDDTVVPNASVGEYVTVARRAGEDWFVGSATGTRARELEIPLDFLDGRRYGATVYRDADDADLETNPTAVATDSRTVTDTDTVTAAMVEGGGHAMRLSPE